MIDAAQFVLIAYLLWLVRIHNTATVQALQANIDAWRAHYASHAGAQAKADRLRRGGL